MTLDTHYALRAVLLGVLLCFIGCAEAPALYPMTTGAHIPTAGHTTGRFVVWANHSGVGQYITSLVLRAGQTVVERHRLEEVFNEQRIRLMHTPDDYAHALRVGRMVGATHVIFAEVSIVGEFVSVAVRSVTVDSGEVVWTGTAQYLYPVSNTDHAAIAATYWAIARAGCRGQWENSTGCQSTQTADTSTQRSIWKELDAMERHP